MPVLNLRPPLQDEDIDELRAALARVAETPETHEATSAEAAASVTIGVSGGAPSERYELAVSLSGAGDARYRFLDKVEGRREQLEHFRVSPEETAKIFELLEPLVTPPPRALYTPDSLVGFVTVRVGRLEAQTTFPVREARGGASPGNAVQLGATDTALHVDPDQIPDGLILLLTGLFGEMSSLVARHTPSP